MKSRALAFRLGVDDVLRRRGWAAVPAQSVRSSAAMAAYAVCFGALYGAAMGTYGGFAVGRSWDELKWQILYSAIKVPCLLAATCAVSLPSFFVLNTLAGLRDDFLESLRAVTAAQAGVAIILASLAPLTLFWYASSADYAAALFVNGIFFAVAALAAQSLLRSYYEPLVARNARHRKMLWLWLGIYWFVGIQMSWIMRPFVGSPLGPVEFVRRESFDNAYVVVSRLAWRILFGA